MPPILFLYFRSSAIFKGTVSMFSMGVEINPVEPPHPIKIIEAEHSPQKDLENVIVIRYNNFIELVKNRIKGMNVF